MPSAQIVICGTGITGLAIARELLARGADDLLLIDKEPGFGAHASSRNSGVLHAGIYYTPSSQRARFCLEGNRLLQDYCRERGLPLQRTGKVIVATSPEQLPALEELFARARSNRTPVRLLDPKELHELEPHARTVDKALYSPETAVVDPGAILASLHRQLAESGKARFLFNTRVQGKGRGRKIRTSRGDIGYELFLNAAGAHSDRLAHAFGVGLGYRILPFKGIYRELAEEKQGLVRGNIYPVPDIKTPFLGVHFTRGISGRVHAGPTAMPALGREHYGLLQGLDREWLAILARCGQLLATDKGFRTIAGTELQKYRGSHFFAAASKLLQGLQPGDLRPSRKVGIRPQLIDMQTRQMVMDFLVLRGEASVHILNAISPAFTSSMAFAKMIATDYCER